MRRIGIILAVALCSVMAHAIACPTGYSTSVAIVIAAEAGQSADVSNFQMYFTGSSVFATVANGGHAANSPGDGTDIVFCDALTSGNLLYHELEASSYSASLGTGRWWIQVPTVSKTVTKTIYAFLGNSASLNWNNPFNIPGSVNSGVFVVGETVKNTGNNAATLINISPFTIRGYPTNTGFGGPTDTWTGQTSSATYSQSSPPTNLTWPSYLYVLHYGTPSSLTFIDSVNLTSGTNVNTSTATTGQVGGAIAFASASSQGLDVNPLSGGTLFNTSTVSFMAWIKATSFPNAYNSVMSNEALSSGYTLLVKSTGKLAIYMDGGANYDGSGTNTLSTGTIYFVGFSYTDSTKVLVGYLNGVQDGTNTGGSIYNGVTAMHLGYAPAHPTRNWNGWEDESRVCNCVLSADYHLASYNSMNSPGTFYTIGSPVGGATGFPVVY